MALSKYAWKPFPAIDDLAPGITPIGFTCLVLLAEMEETTRGGIIVNVGENKEREELAGTHGMLVALSELAGEEVWGACRPEPGDMLTFERYSGQPVEGDDGRMYRLMQDKQVIAVRRAQQTEAMRDAA